LKVYPLTVGPLGTACYVVADEAGRAAVIDPGADAGRIQTLLASMGLSLKAILLTHTHFDHMAAVDALADPSVALYCHAADAAGLTDPARNLSAMFGEPTLVRTEPTLLEDGDTVTVGDLCFDVWHTPGHSPGSVCYMTPEVIFSGDTLFYESVGRTDFPGSSPLHMTQSLRRLLALPGDRKVYPGHMQPTTLSHERQYNPYIS